MFTKATTHLRPLLPRLPTSSHTHLSINQVQPEHFTPNPNLLHHLPQHGGNGVVVHSSSSGGAAAGRAGSGGWAGYGGSGGAGAGAGSGGYTGHARAFLSLPQTGSVDPTSGLIVNDDNNKSQTRALFLKQRLGKQTRFITPDGRTLSSRELEARGGRMIGLVEVEDKEGRYLEDSPSSPRSTRRSSISFSQPSTPTSETPLLIESIPEDEAGPSRLGTPLARSAASTPTGRRRTRPDTLMRTSTNVEIWQVGMNRIGLRAMSSRPSMTSLADALELEEELESVVLGKKSTRLMMDLVGVEVRRRVGSIRRNSTAAMERPSLDSPPPFMTEPTKKEPTTHENDQRIIDHVTGAKYKKQVERGQQLVAHYRSTRSTSPFAAQQVSGDPELAEKFPLPPGYDVKTYNSCLDFLVSTRNEGESIAPILEIYNEMLERDLVPNGRTYQIVIEALCLREKDVWTAATKWEGSKRWGEWKTSQGLGTSTKRRIDKSFLVDGYKAEGNFASALKLFRAALMLHGNWKFKHSMFRALIEACVSGENLEVNTMKEIFEASKKQGREVGVYKYLFQGYGRLGDAEMVNQTWEEYRSNKNLNDISAWTDLDAKQGISTSEARVLGFQRETQMAAFQAFLAVGQLEKAMEIHTSMLESLQNPNSTSLSHRGESMGWVVVHLAEAGHFDLAKEWYDRLLPILEQYTNFYQFQVTQLIAYMDALTLNGRWKEALDIYSANINLSTEVSFKGDIVRLRRFYYAALGEAIKTGTPESLEMLDRFPPLLRHVFADVDEVTLRSHVGILLKHGKYSSIPSLLQSHMDTSNPAGLSRLLHDILISPAPLPESLACIRHMDRCRVPLSEVDVRVVVDKYISSASTPEIWTGGDAFRLIECFSRLPVSEINEGVFDETFIRLLNDLKLVAESGQLALDSGRRNVTVEILATQLVSRFGYEGARQMLIPVWGEAAAKEVTRTDEAAVSETNPSFQFSSDPTTPTSMSTPPFAPQSPLPDLTVDPELSFLVDKHTARNPPITIVQAYEAVQNGLAQGRVPHADSLGRLIVSVSRQQGGEPIVQELYSIAQSSVATCSNRNQQSRQWQHLEDSMLVASCNLGHLEQAGMHRGRLLQAGMAPSADAYATMIASSKDTTDEALVARELWEESQAMGVKPHLYLYNTIISKLSKARKAEMAIELFMQMKQARVHPSSVTYGAVINACCRVGDAESAQTLFAEMASQHNFKPRVPPFNTMMQFHLQTRPSRERVLFYFNAMRQANVPPSAHTYKLLLDAYATLPPVDLESMERVFSDLCADPNVPVQGTHWASLITAYGLAANDISKAIQIFDSIPSHPSTRGAGGYEPVVWEAILNVIGNRGTIEELEDMRQRMIDSGSRPTAYVYNALISGYTRANRISDARTIFESMGDSITGVAAPNNHPQLLTSSGHVKPSTVTFEETNVVYREPSTYEAMIRAELKAGTREAAEGVLRRMEERRYPVAVYMRARAILEEGDVAYGPGISYGWKPAAQVADGRQLGYQEN